MFPYVRGEAKLTGCQQPGRGYVRTCMRAMKLGLGLVAAIAIAFQPAAAASAERLVPPENSAANQYAETYPTAAGNAPSGTAPAPSPAKVLGARNAGRLEGLGPQGRAAAALAAATAPAQSVAGRGVTASRSGAGSRGAAANGGGPGAGPAQPSASSGLSQVIAQATGSSSSGQMGLLLPLIVVAAVAWSVAYLWRRRRTVSQ